MSQIESKPKIRFETTFITVPERCGKICNIDKYIDQDGRVLAQRDNLQGHYMSEWEYFHGYTEDSLDKALGR
jgi:hypothetical protein